MAKRKRKRRSSGMAFKGSHCTKGYKRVKSVYGGTVLRCKGFGRGRRKKRKGYGRGHPPANKGKKCKPSHLRSVWSPRYGKMVTRCIGKGAYGGKRNGNGNGARWGWDPMRGYHKNGSQRGPMPTGRASGPGAHYAQGARGYQTGITSFFGP